MKTLLLLTLLTLINNSSATTNTPHPSQKADIKPALTTEGIDKEEMRITKIIHKRILKQQAIENKAKHTINKQPIAYTDKLDSGASLEMLPIKAGSFTWQGTDSSDTLQVTLSPFWIGKTEVTWEQYQPFMNAEITREKNGQAPAYIRKSITSDIDFIARPTPQYYPINHSMQILKRPAIGMTHHAANKFCQWISYQTGHFYRLPTEAEWEYACRADSKTKFSWGNNPQDASKYAWFNDSPSSHYKQPGQKKPNPWGILDMHGNVLELTLDQFTPNRQKYFGKKNVTNPWIKATKPYQHVTKGGHWKHKLKDITASSRHPSKPNWKATDPQNTKSLWYFSDTPWLGMRIVRPANIPTPEEMYHYWNSGTAADSKFAKYK